MSGYLPYLDPSLSEAELKQVLKDPAPHQIRNAVSDLLAASAFLRSQGVNPADVLLNPAKYLKRHKRKKITRGTR